MGAIAHIAGSITSGLKEDLAIPIKLQTAAMMYGLLPLEISTAFTARISAGRGLETISSIRFGLERTAPANLAIKSVEGT